jgi:hypothetical protein
LKRSGDPLANESFLAVSLVCEIFQELAVLSVVVLMAGVLVLPACTSDASPGAAADSTTTRSRTAPPQSSPEAPPSRDVKGRPDRSPSEKLADRSVATKVKRALIDEPSLRVLRFAPTVIDGHLILRGDVNTPAQYRRAERVAGRVDGVQALTNQLTMNGRPVTAARLAGDDSTATDEEDTAVYHTVDEGDTLWKIAREYRTSIEQLRRLNALRSGGLSPGQRLQVR